MDLLFKRFKAGPRSWRMRQCKTEAAFQRAWGKNHDIAEYIPAHAFVDEHDCIVYLNMESLGDNHELLVHTILHEWEHVVQLTLGVNSDDHDEEEIDRRSAILAQILLTGK